MDIKFNAKAGDSAEADEGKNNTLDIMAKG